MTLAQATTELISYHLISGMHFLTDEGKKSIEKIIEQATNIGFEEGDFVMKLSGKPFKSTFKVNRVHGFLINPNTKRIALTFWEDDSIVDAHICTKVDEPD